MSTSTGPLDVHRSRLRAGAVAALAVGALMLVGSGSAFANDYWLTKAPPVSTAHCYQGLPFTGLSPFGPGTTNATATGQALLACSPPFSAASLKAGDTGTVHVWFTNTGKKDCSTYWFLAHGATPTHAPTAIVGTGPSYGGGPYIYVDGRTTVPTEQTLTFTVPSDTPLTGGDQLTLWIDVRTQSGSCSNMTLYYGPSYGAHPSLSVPVYGS
jgi:hypothetical protein